MPWRPKRSSRNRPTTTGDTVNGMSMSAVRKARPGKRKRAIAHAPAIPKTRFSSTATGATMSVSLIECRVSGSRTRLSQ